MKMHHFVIDHERKDLKRLQSKDKSLQKNYRKAMCLKRCKHKAEIISPCHKNIGSFWKTKKRHQINAQTSIIRA